MVLNSMVEWLTQVRLDIGNISQVVLCGDFNARAGTLISGQAWDTTEDSRGRQMFTTLQLSGLTPLAIYDETSGVSCPPTFYVA